ncbi:MAG: cytochrome c oxidase assembly protein [Proteobacteria bacterium]|nr:cytochrome c oxidase assembly protein [Pseudomonadota bacterium]
MPSAIGLVLPWEFSPTVFGTVALAAVVYARGAAGASPRIALPRRCAFFTGLLLIYAALQTSWDYYASHMFTVLQLQHFALHDLAPALLMGAAPGAALLRGLPLPAREWLRTRSNLLRGPLRLLLDPRVATILYAVSLLAWLWPPITFDVMVSNGLYKLMSWSAVLGALPFWHLVLDPREYPRARLRLPQRFALLYIGMAPMMLMSAALAFSHRDWYPVYKVCGRFLAISAVADQELGGLAMWVPGGLLFGGVFIAFLGRRFEQQGRPVAQPPGKPARSN